MYGGLEAVIFEDHYNDALLQAAADWSKRNLCNDILDMRFDTWDDDGRAMLRLVVYFKTWID